MIDEKLINEVNDDDDAYGNDARDDGRGRRCRNGRRLAFEIG